VKSFIRNFALLMVMAVGVNSLNAGIIVTAPLLVKFQKDSGVNSFDIFARSTTPAAPSDALSSLVVDVQIGNGVLNTPAGAFGGNTLGDPNPFLFSTAGVLNAASALSRDSNVNASLSLDFNTSGVFTSTDQRLFRIDINVDGLAPGIYPVTFLGVDPQSLGGTPTGLGVNGSFEVVPEPTSLMLLSTVAMGGIFVRRRRSAVAC
jgi:hypothetical protein